MSFRFERTGAVLVVAITGQLIVTNRQAFKQAVLEAVEQGTRLVVIDCHAAEHIDSSGLGLLVSLRRRLDEAGGDLRVVALNEDFRRLFELTRLDTHFPPYLTRDAALSA